MQSSLNSQLANSKNLQQLDLFSQRLPKKPYFTDDLDMGLMIRAVKTAIKARYIQPNGATHKYWLCFDVDRPSASVDWYELNAPTPNIIAKNRQNGHAHLIYGLEVPIRTAIDAKEHPLRYAAAIECSLRALLGADVGYSGLIVKNPLNEHWDVSTPKNELYNLGYLSEFVDLTPFADKRKKFENYGLGRNCNLFECQRKWAYQAIRQDWRNYESWYSSVLQHCLEYNRQHLSDNPLSYNEIQHTAKSIAKWVWRNMSSQGFKEWQAKQGRKGGIAKGKANADKRAKALMMVMQGNTQQHIANVLGVTDRTLRNWLNSKSGK